MKGTVVALLVLAMLGAPLAVAGVAGAEGARDLTPVIERGATDRLGGGDWITVRAGDARVGVVYGVTGHPNKLYVFAEYTRYLGGADVYDGQGNLLRSGGIPVFTLFGQSFDAFIEFRDTNGDSMLDFRSLNDTLHDRMEKLARLDDRVWSATDPTTEVSGNTTWVNFTISTDNVPYSLVWERLLPRRGTAADGALRHLAFTFHLKVDTRDVRGEVPWWRVTIDDGNQRRVAHVERMENRTVEGNAVAMGAKYDHLIEGWDFASSASRLALETRSFIGYDVPQPVGQFLHAAYRTEAGNGTGFRYRRNDTDLRPLTGDYVYFNDDWQRVGRLVWANDVTVDGRADTMLFQVQGGEGFSARRGEGAFAGFAIRGAYVYPAGAVIEHDPGLDAVSDLWNVRDTLNLTPMTVLAAQIAVAGIAIVGAVLLRVRGRRAK